MNEENILEIISDVDIYVYGAGRNATRILEYMIEHGKKIQGFLVKDIANNPETLFGVPVMMAKDYHQKDDDVIICSIVYGIGNVSVYHNVLQQIISYGWSNVVFFSKNTFQPIYTWKQRKQKQLPISLIHQGEYYIDRNAPAELGHSVMVMQNGDQSYRWRVEDTTIESIFSDLLKTFSEKSALEEFQEQYGAYHSWKKIDDNTGGCISGNYYGYERCGTLESEDAPHDNPRLLVYMTRSTGDACVPSLEMPSWIRPIQVGAAITDKHICSLRDDQGENISERNPIYSEGTAIYWMWKNAEPSDYIGLFHYRRHIDLGEKCISSLRDIDVLVSLPTFSLEGLKNIFSRYIPDSDVNQLLASIGDEIPEYFDDARRFLESRFYPPCNLFIMRRDIFQKYCEFLFSITFSIEKFYDDRKIIRCDRYMGYLVECLMGIFLMHHKDEYRIAYSDMLFFQS